MLPEIMSRVNAPLTIIAGTDCRRMLMMFGTPMNFGDIRVNTRMIIASTPITYRLLTADFTEIFLSIVLIAVYSSCHSYASPVQGEPLG